MKKVFIIKKTLQIFFILIAFFILINISFYLYSFITPKMDIKSANSIYLYDAKGNLVVKGVEDKQWVLLKDMGPFVIPATISIEDKNFFKHGGFDFLRIAKAIGQNITSGEIVAGASTITQQYARNLFLDFGQTWERKLKEMVLAFELETHYTKQEILEGYLNTIDYGQGIYGIGNASKYYFNKDIKDLSLAEVTMLVGIPNSPGVYSPVADFDAAKERQAVILDRMVINNYITKEEVNNIKNEEIIIYGKKEEYNLSTLMYYKDAVMQELNRIKTIPKSYLETGGLKIYTTLDIDAQIALENSINDSKINEDIQTAKVMMDPNTGSVIALIGGTSYAKTQYNRAINAYRQPGSIIKPFLYYEALKNGFTSSTTFLSAPTTFFFDDGKSYSPKNSGNIYGNKDITLATAIAYSDNIYAVKTHLFLGEEKMVNILHKVGLNKDFEPVPSLPLGTYEVSALEMASAYAMLANNGKKVNSHFITKVEDINGNLLYEYKIPEDEYVLDEELTYIISELLTTSYDSSLIDFAYPTCINMTSKLTNKYAIKSGSTDTDVWVAGYNKDIVLISWTGYDNNKDIDTKIVSSNKSSWVSSIEEYFKDKETSWYSTPKNVVGVLVNPVTGKIATAESKNKKIMYYISGTQPTITD